MSDFLQDLKYGFKTLVRNPGFALVAVLTLALGIGTNGAIFSIVDTVLFRPYPYQNPEDLVMVRMISSRDGDDTSISYPDFVDLRKRNKSFADLAAVDFQSFNVSGGDVPIRVRGGKVTTNVLSLVGSKPLLGRTFLPTEEGPGAERVVILSDTLWHRSFGGDPSLVGKTIRLDGEPYTLVGIVSAQTQWPDVNDTEVFVPVDISPDEADRSARAFMVLARLRQGVSVGQAQADLDILSSQLAQENPESNEAWTFGGIPLREFRTRSDRSLLLLVQATVLFVLLIACINVANLLLQRLTSRQREISLRTALGARRERLVRQLLTESIPLVVLGALVGIFFSHLLIKLVVAMLPSDELPVYLREFSLNPRVILFLLAASALSVFFFGLAPALRLRSANVNLAESLKEGGRSSSGGRRRQRMRGVLVVVEVGLSLVLLMAAGLMIKSFRQILQVDPGFNPDGLIASEMALPDTKYSESSQRMQFYRVLLDRIRAQPGVESVAAGRQLPFGSWSGSAMMLEGQSEEQAEENPLVGVQLVLGNYFQTIDLPLLKGREFGPQDATGSPNVVIINNNFARRIWPDQDPVGKRIRLEATEEAWLTVVGVVGDVRRRGLNENLTMDAYLPYEQVQEGSMIPLTRASASPESLYDPLREQIRSLDSDLPVNLHDMRQVINDSVSVQRVASMLFALFGALALLLAAVGLYGVMSYSVSQRTHEIGVRMALGSSARDVLGLVLKQSLRLVVIGMVCGLIGAFVLTKLMSSLLFEVSPADPMTLLSVVIVLVTVALLAAYVPARRAASVSPVVALKYE